MDINDFYTADEHEKGREVAINNPSTGEPSDVVFIVRGPDSKTFRRAILKSNRANLEVDDTDSMTDLLVAVTIGWKRLEARKWQGRERCSFLSGKQPERSTINHLM